MNYQDKSKEELISELQQLQRDYTTLSASYQVNDLEHKQAKEALLESEAKYRNIYDNALEGIFQTSLDGKFLTSNQALATMLGYASAEHLMKAVTFTGSQVWLNNQEREQFISLLEKNGVVRGFVCQFKCKDGEIFWVSLNARMVNDSHGKKLYYEGFAQDVTARKQAEFQLVKKTDEIDAQNEEYLQLNEELVQINEELSKAKENAEESEKLYRLLAENSSDIVWLMDLNLDFVYISPSAEKLTGYTFNERKIFTIDKIYKPETIARLKALLTDSIQRYYKTGIHEPQLFEIEGIHKNGYPLYFEISANFLVDDQGRVTGIQGTSRDIAERKKAEYALIVAKEIAELEEKKFKAIFENSLDAIVSAKFGVINYVNPALLNLFGYQDPNEIIGKSLLILAPPKAHTFYEQQIQNGKTVQSFYESIGIRKNGEEFPIEAKFGLYELNNDKYSISIIRDVSEYKLALKKNQESEKRLRQIIDLVPHFIFAKDINGKFILVNQALAKVYGTTVENLIGKTDADFDPNKDEVEHFLEVDRKVIESGISTYHVEECITDSNGATKILDTTKIPFTASGTNLPAVLGVSVDITERKLTEIALKESEKKYKTLFEANTDGITIFRLLENEPPFTIIDMNQNAHNMLGYTKKEMLMLPPHHLEKDITYEKLGNRMEDLKTKGYSNFETILKHKNGYDIYVDIRVMVINYDNQPALMNIVRDITERKMVEVKLQEKNEELQKAKEKAEESEQKYKQIFDNTFDIMSIYEVTEENRFKVLTFNAAEAKLIGPLEYYQNKYIDECIPPELYNQFKQNYELCIKEEKLIVYEEDIAFQNINKTFHTQLIPLKNNAGRIHRIIVISRDITDNKLLTTQLYNQNEKLKSLNSDLIIAKEKAEESDRLKTAFLNNMSHEVRTPLNAIVGFSELLASSSCKPEKFIEYANLISSSSNKLIQIITDVIELSEITANLSKVILTNVDIIPLIKHQTAKFSEIAVEKNIAVLLNITIPHTEFVIKTDVSKFKKIYTHLIDNAIKFTHSGSVKITCEIRGEQLKITISDTGIGISEEKQKIILEPFTQIDTGISRNYGGNGIGLPIAMSYIELLNGDFSINSEINKGTTITFSVPINKTLHHNHQIITNMKSMQNTILIAEDEYSNYRFLFDLLADTNTKILHAKNGTIALEMCKADDSIDLVLMDIEMPVMDGHTATKLIKEFRPRLPIIAQTTYALESEKEIYQDVFDAYITKPIRRIELKQILSKYISI